MLEASRGRTGIDRVGISTSFGGVFLEGLEVVFIVVALGGLENVASAAVGALVSLVVVAVAGIALRTPLTQVPEDTMKYVVGIMLTSFGTFFAGEGLGVQWWQEDLSLLPLIAAYGLASIAFVLFLKRTPRPSSGRTHPILHGLQTAVLELWGLFVDDGTLAVVALFAVAWYTDHVSGQRGAAAVLLVIGVLAAIAIGLTGPYRGSRQTAKAAAPLTLATGEPEQPSAVVPQETLVPR